MESKRMLHSLIRPYTRSKAAQSGLASNGSRSAVEPQMGQSPLAENEQAKASDASVLTVGEKQAFDARLKNYTVPITDDQFGSLLNLGLPESGLVHGLCLVASNSDAIDAESLLSAYLTLSQRLMHRDYGEIIVKAFAGSNGKVEASKIRILLSALLQSVAGIKAEDDHKSQMDQENAGNTTSAVRDSKQVSVHKTQSLVDAKVNPKALTEKGSDLGNIYNDDADNNAETLNDSNDQRLLNDDFRNLTMALLRFIDNTISAENVNAFEIDADSCALSLNQLRPVLKSGFACLFRPLFENSTGRLPSAFAGTSPMTDATRALISMALSQSAGIAISSTNLVKLYDGSSEGFSLRSLETSVLKWQAPSILLISGKQLSRKTRASNRRYLQFEERLPPITSQNSSEQVTRKGDIITLAVLFECPWRKSEKTFFGTLQTTIMSILPVFNMFKAKGNYGAMASFSSTMGIGVGNDLPSLARQSMSSQPYLAGDISLTIEPNLEYAVWRHLSKSGRSSCFSRGMDVESPHDAESRISIRSIQVWGIGSDEQLAEQKRQWAWENQQAQARQNINVDALGDDRAFLEMAGLVGNHGAGGLV